MKPSTEGFFHPYFHPQKPQKGWPLLGEPSPFVHRWLTISLDKQLLPHPQPFFVLNQLAFERRSSAVYRGFESLVGFFDIQDASWYV